MVTSLDITNVSISDVDAGDGEMEVEMFASTGLLSIESVSATKLTFPGRVTINGTETGGPYMTKKMIFTGKLKDINFALATLKYTSVSILSERERAIAYMESTVVIVTVIFIS